MTTLTRCYLRASTDQQDASRARGQLEQFATDHGLTVAGWYPENESGASLKRPELFRLLNDCKAGDILLIEQVDRLSRLSTDDWATLRREIDARQVRIVALDLPTSHQGIGANADETTARIMAAVNGMLLDILAAVARKDYDDRRRRQAQGIATAKQEGRYKGRQANKSRNSAIIEQLKKGVSWSAVQAGTGCSRSTIAKLAKALPTSEH